MNNIILLQLSLLTLAGCAATQSSTITISKLPTCGEVYEVLQAADAEFDDLKSGPKIQIRGSSYPYWQSSIVLAGADECIIREKDYSSYQFRCSWIHGNNKPSMGQHYQALRDRVISCVGDVQVSRNDLKGYTVIYLEPTSQTGQLQYWIRAKYETPPYRVTFDIDAQQ